MPGRIEETLNAWDRITGNDGASYIKSDEARQTIMEGFAQLTRGEAPTKIVDYTQNLLSRRMDPRQVDQIVSQMLGHFREAERTRKTNTLQGELRGSPATEEPVQLGGPGFDETQAIAPLAQPARPPREATQADVLGVAHPDAFKSMSGFGPFLAAPSAIRENEGQAGNARAQEDYHKVQTAIKNQQANALENLPDQADPNLGGLSFRQIGQGSGGTGLAPVANNIADNAALAPQRAAQTRLEDMRSVTERARPGLIGAQTGAANAAAGASRASAGASTELGALRKRTDPNIRAGVDKDGNPIVTETDESINVKPEDRLMAEDAIAATAKRRGMTSAAGLAQVANDMGYELEGDAALTEEQGYFKNGPPKLTGNFSLKPKSKTKTTTKGKADKMPDKAPADKPAPGRLRFNAKGEPIR